MPYVIQGTPTSLPSEPILQDDKHFVSLHDILGALGGSATFDNSTKTATATIAPWTGTVTEGDTSVSMTGNGQTVPVTISEAPYIDGDEMFVPYDFFHDAFGYTTSFDGDTLSITNPNIPTN